MKAAVNFDPFNTYKDTNCIKIKKIPLAYQASGVYVTVYFTEKLQLPCKTHHKRILERTHQS